MANSEALERAYEIFTSDAGFPQQAAMLGFTLDQYEGKTVLDIGSGRTNRFANEAMQYVGSLTVISVNPQLADAEVCKKQNIDRSAHGMSVAALAQGKLPFKSGSFDMVISVLGVPNALLDTEVPDMYNEEIWRVLKPGGVASLWPPRCRRTHTGQPLVATEHVNLAPVNTDVLEILPQPYQSQTHRLEIHKPDVADLEDEIAHFETSTPEES